MKTLLRIAMIGIIIWIIGVGFYSLSFYIHILEDADLQANILLTLSVMPLVWFGTKAFYKMGNHVNGVLLGFAYFLIAGVLDAVFTVPYLVIPNGGSYQQFFTELGFWLIGFEFITISTFYWYFNPPSRSASADEKVAV